MCPLTAASHSSPGRTPSNSPDWAAIGQLQLSPGAAPGPGPHRRWNPGTATRQVPTQAPPRMVRTCMLAPLQTPQAYTRPHTCVQTYTRPLAMGSKCVRFSVAQNTTVSSIVPMHCAMLSDMSCVTLAARCFLASILPTLATTRFSGGCSCSSITALS